MMGYCAQRACSVFNLNKLVRGLPFGRSYVLCVSSASIAGRLRALEYAPSHVSVERSGLVGRNTVILLVLG